MSAVKRSLNVGFVGLGNIGAPIVRNIAFKNRNSLYLQLMSRDIRKARHVADQFEREGAQVAIRLHNQYPTMTKWCDVIFSCVKDVEAARAVMLEREDALIRNARRGQIIVEHSTVDAETAKECHEEATKRGAYYMDAMLSGNEVQAEAAQMTCMVGAEDEPYKRVLPLIRLYCENVHRVGDPGAGAATKGICQMLVSVHTVAAAEAITMAQHLGVEDPRKIFNVLDSTWASSTMLRRNAKDMTTLLRNPEMVPRQSSTSVEKLYHDIKLLDGISGLSEETTHSAFPLYWKSQRILQRTMNAGVGQKDIASVVHFLGADGNTRDHEGGLDDIRMGGGGGGSNGNTGAPSFASAGSSSSSSMAPDSDASIGEGGTDRLADMIRNARLKRSEDALHLADIATVAKRGTVKKNQQNERAPEDQEGVIPSAENVEFY